MKFIKVSKIVKKDNKYQVQSEKGRNLGTYNTKSEADKRLKQVEMFKHMKKKSSYDDNFTFEFDLSKGNVDEYFRDGDIINLDKNIANIFNIDPEAEIWDKKFEGKIIWTTDFNLNNRGIEWMLIQAKPATVNMTVRIGYFKNEQDKENDDVTEETFEIPLNLKEIKVEADKPFVDGTALYPSRLEIYSPTTATLVFDE